MMPMKIVRPIAGFVAGFLAMMVLSIPLGMLVDRLAPEASMLAGSVLMIDFALSIVVVALAGWLAIRIGGPASAYALAAVLVVATASAPAPNWPMAANVAYAIVAVAVLLLLAKSLPRLEQPRREESAAPVS